MKQSLHKILGAQNSESENGLTQDLKKVLKRDSKNFLKLYSKKVLTRDSTPFYCLILERMYLFKYSVTFLIL